MKGICLAVLLGFTTTCFAQDTTLFDKIVITYSHGGDTFGAPGVSSVGEIFELVPKDNTGYKFEYFKKTKNSISPDRQRYIQDTVTAPVKKGRISKTKIDDLFAALGLTKDNYTPEFIKPFLKRPSKLQILADTNYVNKGYKFEDEDQNALKAIFKRMRQFDQIDSFINENKPSVMSRTNCRVKSF